MRKLKLTLFSSICIRKQLVITIFIVDKIKLRKLRQYFNNKSAITVLIKARIHTAQYVVSNLQLASFYEYRVQACKEATKNHASWMIRSIANTKTSYT